MQSSRPLPLIPSFSRSSFRLKACQTIDHISPSFILAWSKSPRSSESYLTVQVHKSHRQGNNVPSTVGVVSKSRTSNSHHGPTVPLHHLSKFLSSPSSGCISLHLISEKVTQAQHTVSNTASDQPHAFYRKALPYIVPCQARSNRRCPGPNRARLAHPLGELPEMPIALWLCARQWHLGAHWCFHHLLGPESHDFHLSGWALEIWQQLLALQVWQDAPPRRRCSEKKDAVEVSIC